AAAFATVATEAPDKALDFLTELFAQQPEEGSKGLTDDEVAQIAVDAGVPQDVADQIGDGTYTEWVDKATEQAGNDGVSQTPTVKLDGEVWQGNWSEPGALLSAIEDACPRPFVEGVRRTRLVTIRAGSGTLATSGSSSATAVNRARHLSSVGRALAL